MDTHYFLFPTGTPTHTIPLSYPSSSWFLCLARTCLGPKRLATDESGPKCHKHGPNRTLRFSCRQNPSDPKVLASRWQQSAFNFQFSDLGRACRTWLSLGLRHKNHIYIDIRYVIRILDPLTRGYGPGCRYVPIFVRASTLTVTTECPSSDLNRKRRLFVETVC